MKGRLSRIIGALLISIGITTLGYVGFKKYEVYKEQKAIMDEVEASMNQYKEELGDYKTDGTDENLEKKSQGENKSGAVGIIEIPSIGVKAGIVSGTTQEKIKYSIGHFEDSVMPGEKGNFALAGHNTNVGAEFFGKLHELKKGDKINIRTAKNKYTYSVTKVFEVAPTDLTVLEQTPDETITLITCTPGGKRRVTVKGVLDK